MGKIITSRLFVEDDELVLRDEEAQKKISELSEEIDNAADVLASVMTDYKVANCWQIGSITESGEFTENPWAIRTKTKIAIPFDKLRIFVKKGFYVYVFEYYNNNTLKSFVTYGVEDTDRSGIGYTVEIDKNCLYAFSIQEKSATTETVLTDTSISENAFIGLDKNKIVGRWWNPVGDSISDTSNPALGLYIPIIAKNLGLSTINCGVASSTLAVNNTYLQNQSIVERVCGLNGNAPMENADVWTIYGGLNDWYYNSPIGSIDNDDPATIYGALKHICYNIIHRNNHPKLILCTPLQSNRNGVNGDISMAEIRQAIKDVAELFSVPCVDLYAIGGLNQWNIIDPIKPTTTDGVHPNEYGTLLWYRALQKVISELNFEGVGI